MLIYTIWVSDFASFDEAWILNAWDEYSIDGNHEGWCETVESAKKQYKEVRIIQIRVNESEIKNVFEIPPIDGKIESA